MKESLNTNNPLSPPDNPLLPDQTRGSKFELAKISEPLDEKDRLRAALFAKYVHKGQYRKSGEPFVDHPLTVEEIIYKEWSINNHTMRIAAILHDAPEDHPDVKAKKRKSTSVIKEISYNFGEEVAELDDGVTKFQSEDGDEGSDQETLVKVGHKTYIDARVGILKLADRLHNMRTIDALKEDKQKRKALETLNVYAPLAEALGMWEVKRELEDRSFKIINPEKYDETLNLMNCDQRFSDKHAAKMKEDIENALSASADDEELDFEITDRKNGVYAIYKKLQQRRIEGKDISDIQDLRNIRVTLKNDKQCGRALEALRQAFTKESDSDKIDLYRHDPRINRYTADHLSIRNTEVAIATKDQERYNQMGVISVLQDDPEADLDEYTLKMAFYENKQNGMQVRFMGKEATILDALYAYKPNSVPSIHSVVINGKQVTDFTEPIDNASVIETIAYGESCIAIDPNKIGKVLPSTLEIIDEQNEREKQIKIIESGRKIETKILKAFGLLSISDIPDEKIQKEIWRELGKVSLNELRKDLSGDSSLASGLSNKLKEKGLNNEEPEFTTFDLYGKDETGMAEAVGWLTDELDVSIVSQSSRSPEGRYYWRLTIKGLSLKDREFLRSCFEEDTRFNISDHTPMTPDN